MKRSITIVTETVWENRGAYRLLVGKPERGLLEELQVDGKEGLEWIVKKFLAGRGID